MTEQKKTELKSVHVRLEPEDHERLLKRAKLDGLKLPHWIRQAAFIRERQEEA